MNSDVGDNRPKWLPATPVLIVRVAVACMVVACACFAGISIQQALTGDFSQGLFAILLYIPTAVGLWRLTQWGRWLALAILWLLVLAISTPFGVLGIFAVINGEHFPYPIWREMAQIAPVAIPALFFMEVLYSYRGEFEFSRSTPAPADVVPPIPTPPDSWLLWTLAVLGTPMLMVYLLLGQLQAEGGCFPLEWGPGSGIFVRTGLPSILAILLGSLIYLRALLRGRSRWRLAIRVFIYAVMLLLFRSAIGGYVWYYSRCAG
jgi:hypothetical protein